MPWIRWLVSDPTAKAGGLPVVNRQAAASAAGWDGGTPSNG